MNHVDTTSPITHISLCAGYGGIDIGLARAIPDLRTIAFSEIEAFACANLVSKMEAGLLDCAPIWTDLKTFPWDEFLGKVDIISGGFPCQPFSCAGKRNGDEDPRHLFPYILDGIRRSRPSIVFLENVEGIISSKLNGEGWNDPAGTPVLLHVLRELERVGYKATAGVFSASEVGAPHQRKRVFIMAHRKCEGLEGWRRILQPESLECRSSKHSSEGGNLLVNSINNVGSYVCREQCSQKEQSIISNASNLAYPLCSGSGEDQQPTELRTAWIEQSSRSSRVSSESTQRREVTIWPSRPGQPQYEWEPPRVVGNANGVERRGATNIPRSQGERSTDSIRLESASETNMGNSQRIRLESTRDKGAMGKESGNPSTEGSELASAIEESSYPRIAECKAEPSLGGNLNGTSNWMGHAELYVSCDNRTDELRLLGNGVVPDTATIAFKTLIGQLTNNKTQK